MILHSIRLEDLDGQRLAVLEGIADRGEVYQVVTLGSTFLLGPETQFARVLGLFDEEYGWPANVDAAAPVEEFVPGSRRHPFILRGSRVMAVAISEGEYSEILRQQQEAPTE